MARQIRDGSDCLPPDPKRRVRLRGLAAFLLALDSDLPPEPHEPNPALVALWQPVIEAVDAGQPVVVTRAQLCGLPMARGVPTLGPLRDVPRERWGDLFVMAEDGSVTPLTPDSGHGQ